MKLLIKAFILIMFLAYLTFTLGDIQTLNAGLREDLGLIALWTLDEETIKGNIVEDESGDFPGTITGNPKVIPGAIGDALSFDGQMDLIRMTNDIFFPAVSMEAIIKPVLGTRNPIYDKYNYGIQLLDSDQVGIWIRADTQDTAKQWISAYTPFPKDRQWHHVVGIAEDQKNVRIYLDGKLKATTPAPDSISMAYGAQVKPSIAYTQHMNGIWYEGDIDEVAIYEGALSDDDVNRLYAGALTVQPKSKLANLWGKIKQAKTQ
ncbi:hypothetical protein GF312_16910 [Candidatus Poribacteria bacterium]|nr:hypothetical protein [Candidatus Poribacteria bacterium]